jgi:hypothetical protein
MVALGTSLLAADWPPESPHLAAAVTRLQRVVAALTRAIAYSFELNDGGTLVCVRGYKRLESWDPDAYERLSGQFELNRAVVYALVAELTRTANLFIDGVRMDIDPLFRTVEGRALTVEGDGVVFDVVHIRLEYWGVDWSTIAAFPDLDSIRERLKSEVQELDIELSELDFHSLEFR